MGTETTTFSTSNGLLNSGKRTVTSASVDLRPGVYLGPWSQIIFLPCAVEQTVITHENSNTTSRNVLQHAEFGLGKDPTVVFDVEIDNSIVLQRGVLDKFDFAINCAFRDEI